jgi:SAM-dependent methyltransferase
MDEAMFAAFARVERSHWWFGARRDIVLGVLANHVKPGARLLDVGCGTGFFLEAAGVLYDAWGVDPSATAVRLCHERGMTRVLEGTAEALPVEGIFDAVLFLDVLEHLDDDFAALAEARRHLAPGGIVLVTVPAYMALWSDHDVVNQHRRRYSKSQLRDRLLGAGLGIRQLTYFNSYLFPAAVAERFSRRLGRRAAGALLPVPPAPLNRAMQRIFASEQRRLARQRPGTFPFGLSVLAVAQN